MNRRVVISNFIWRFLESSGAQLVQFVVSIILARLLMPEDYGTVALMNVFILVLGVFVNCGLSSALIQKKDADDTDFSTVFYAQMLFCIVIYIFLFLAAPFIAKFYSQPVMKWMLRVQGLTLVIAGVKNIQMAYVSRTMQFKRFFFATLGGTIGAAVVGVALAYAGAGAWALVGQSLFNNTVDTIILWVTVKWKPKRLFSLQRLKGLFSYSWKLLISSLLDTVYNNLRSLIIGKLYSSEDLAFYNRGQSWPNLVIGNINSSIDSVLFPSMSGAQSDRNRLKDMTRRAIKTSTYLIAPFMMGLAACGNSLIRLVLTEKWLSCVPFQMIFCFTYMFYPLHTANLNAIKAMGRSDLFLKLEIVKKLIGLIVLAISAPVSVMAMGYSLLVTSIASQIINSWPNKKLLNYGYKEQLKDILPGILLAVGMGMCIYPIQYLGFSDIVTLVFQILIGGIIYISGSVVFKLESFQYLWGIAKPFVVRGLHKLRMN
ncbi:MAG: lipopolysaccharide biosynthesis protein [Clostridiales bacterium]|nr:lipopolysaccharide biosynthesis protein [Clostridiales bacterium]